MKNKRRQESDYRTVLGFTLSKRGWNNVLIYVVLILMFVFYFLGHDSGKIASASRWQPFAERTLVAISDHKVSLVRVANNWEQRAGNTLAANAQARWLQAWQELSLEPSEQLLAGREYQVELTFADEAESWKVGVFFYNGEAFVALPGADQVFRVVGDHAALEAQSF